MKKNDKVRVIGGPRYKGKTGTVTNVIRLEKTYCAVSIDGGASAIFAEEELGMAEVDARNYEPKHRKEDNGGNITPR